MMKKRLFLRANMSNRRSPVKLDEGAVQIEFILSVLTVLFIIFAMWELIMIVHTMNVLSDAAKEGVRYAIVHGEKNDPAYQSGPGSTTAIAQVVNDYAKLSFNDISAMTVRVCYAPAAGTTGFPCVSGGTNELLNIVRVEVQYDFLPYTALPFRPTLRAASEGRIVY
jgi:Flp pilus assembly protein TadG